MEAPGGRAAGRITAHGDALTLTVFVAGRLTNPLNGSWGGWFKHARIAKDWRERTAQAFWVEKHTHGRWVLNPMAAKRVTFTAHVGALWDSDNLPAAVKPLRDALQWVVIHSDGPKSGHVFCYAQVVDRDRRGVAITVEELA